MEKEIEPPKRGLNMNQFEIKSAHIACGTAILPVVIPSLVAAKYPSMNNGTVSDGLSKVAISKCSAPPMWTIGATATIRLLASSDEDASTVIQRHPVSGS